MGDQSEVNAWINKSLDKQLIYKFLSFLLRQE